MAASFEENLQAIAGLIAYLCEQEQLDILGREEVPINILSFLDKLQLDDSDHWNYPLEHLPSYIDDHINNSLGIIKSVCVLHDVDVFVSDFIASGWRDQIIDLFNEYNNEYHKKRGISPLTVCVLADLEPQLDAARKSLLEKVDSRHTDPDWRGDGPGLQQPYGNLPWKRPPDSGGRGR